jgi:hypothetical protein
VQGERKPKSRRLVKATPGGKMVETPANPPTLHVRLMSVHVEGDAEDVAAILASVFGPKS